MAVGRSGVGETGKRGLTIGAVARRVGVSASMIRAWEKMGLVRSTRTNGNYRIYTDEDIQMLRRAVYLRRALGLNAPAIVHQLRQEGLLHAMPGSSSADASPGSRLRKLRLQRGESLSQVARAVNVSIGFLSSLERSQSTASVALMRKLAQYYHLNILDFFDPLNGQGPLVRPRDRKVLETGPGVRMELLATEKTLLEPHLFRVAPGAGSGESYSHAGEEFLYVVRGRLTMILDDREYQIGAGDSFCFASPTQHRWWNPGRSEAVILWINTPPTF